MKLERDPVWGPVFNRAVYLIADRLRDLVEALPGSTARATGRMMGALAVRILGSKIRFAAGQAEAALGPGAGKYAEESVRQFGHLAIELLRVTNAYSRDHWRRRVAVTGVEFLRSAVAEGKGVIAVSAHLGNWEVGTSVMGHLGFPVTWLLRPLENPLIQEGINGIRATAGTHVITKWGGLREGVHVLRRGGILAMLVDQDARDQGVFVPFFGREASTLKSPALLSVRTGAPILPFITFRLPDGRLSLEFAEAFVAEGSDEHEADLERATARFTAVIEGWIRRAPEQWLWVHRRWKTQRVGKS